MTFDQPLASPTIVVEAEMGEPFTHRPELHLLTLPLEIRITLFRHLFQCPDPIKIESTHEEHDLFFDDPQEQQEQDSPDTATTATISWTLRRPKTPQNGLSAQFLRVSREIHDTGLPYLYSLNRFDCSSRSALPLLLTQLRPSTRTSAHIRHVVLDWDQLQDFAWSLAKPAQVAATSGIQELHLANWRMRVLGGSSFLWRDYKSYERQLCQAAKDICLKHPLLRCVLQRPFHRPTTTPAARSESVRATHRVKWRFVTAAVGERVAALGPAGRGGERVVDLDQELALLAPAAGKDVNISSLQGGIDPV
ncbi:hypothetical protein LTR84_007659 [Exophiala bonariae]|uniref:DUF7730 domain-containing protein n=1 Tax=Exophiala bonariae TaxID=1690606 RepID=A0AAV9NL46_9EURO|nr:hypothetical protein LTR84_007659 [Exophiala bonariae]